MKKIVFIIFLSVLSFLFHSGKNYVEVDVDKLKLEIMGVEKRFDDMVAEKGISEAFLFFAAEDAVIMRNNRVFKGKTEIKKYFDSVELNDIKLKWKPDFVDMSSSGDMAYTYGKYVFSARDKAGKILKSEGVFHTVWKRQVDGKWKFVWD